MKDIFLIPRFKRTNRGYEVDCFDGSDGNIYTISGVLARFDGMTQVIVNYNMAKYSIIETLLREEKFLIATGKIRIKTDCAYIKENHIIIYKTPRIRNCICSYENKFMQDFENIETAYQLCNADIYGKISCTQTAKTIFLRSIGAPDLGENHDIFLKKYCYKFFPQPEPDEWELWEAVKPAVNGFTYLKEPGLYSNIYDYDIKGAHASQLWERKLPTGKGKKFADFEHLPIETWFVANILVWDIKPRFEKDYLNYIQLEQTYKIKDIPCILPFTSETWEIFNLLYEAQYQVNYGYYYKMQACFFNRFLEQTRLKPSKTGAEKRYNKTLVNNLIGSFGAKSVLTTHVYALEEDKLKISVETHENEQKAYYPVYLRINGLTKLDIIRDIFVPLREDIIYANTDGFMLTRPKDFTLRNAIHSQLGIIEYRHTFANIAIKDISNYYGEYIVDDDGLLKNKVVLSGGKPPADLTLEEFISGYMGYSYNLSSSGFLQFIKIHFEGMAHFQYLHKAKSYINKHPRIIGYTLIIADNPLIKSFELNRAADLIYAYLTNDSLTPYQINDILTEIHRIAYVSIAPPTVEPTLFYEVVTPFNSLAGSFTKNDIVSENELLPEEIYRLTKLAIIAQL